MQGPEIWLNNLGISVECVVDPEKQALLDVDHRVFVNYETYYLSSDENREKFLVAPWQYTGMLTDPVTKERFQPSADSPRREHANRIFFFQNEGNVALFESAADSLAVPVVPYAGRM
ncbi:MAG: hypothetical protein KDC10_06735 [Calditrichaeota bacterium]|nr:hypothetical protein [Candidatus Cloacimonadota bacterium]MCA9787022.1 hypothetical protein [Candidatus Cloacimonadota bacterium]MCB1046882.1 hypothetical protein [Calditrichota bacterium]MCB9472712.1 hypothetical protein [Candidatus Delongbacteria bacterium]